MILDNTISVIEQLEKNKDDLLLDLIKENEDFVVELNKSQLYNDGIRADGSQVEPRYSRLTITIKSRKGQPTNRVTLKDEGDFYDSFYLEFGSNSFVINARDSKTPSLKEKYNEEILGLTDESKSELSLFLKDVIIQELRSKL